MPHWGLAALDALQALHTPWLDKVMIFFTTLGEWGAVWVLITVALLLRRRTRRLGVCCALALLFSLLSCNLLLKPLLARPRPFTLVEIELLVPEPSEFSFPSGHTASSFAAATALAAAGKRWGGCAYALAALIAFSRLYLYVHFPGDVLGGALLGLCCGMLARWLACKRPLRRRG